MSIEYDAFGPWVYQVRTPDEVPRLFRDGPVDPDRSELVLKVPRNIARRDATPQMDLYDHVVAAEADALTVLSRQAVGYSTTTVPYPSIAAIETGTDLLDGRLVVHSTTGQVTTVPYNGSSQDMVDRLVRVVRSRYLSDQAGGPPLPGDARDGDAELQHFEADLALVSEYGAVLRAEPGMAFLAAHERRVVTPRASGSPLDTLSRLVHFAWPMTLQAAILCGDDRELQVVHRHSWWVRGHVPVHSVARTIVPLERVERVSVRPHEVYDRVVVGTLQIGRRSLELPVPEGSDAEAVFRRAPLPRG